MRVFIAFELPEAVRAELAALSASLQRRLADTPLSWVPPHNLHLTLKFLGQIEADQAAAIADALQGLAQGYTAMPVTLDGLGVFPSPHRPRVVWAGLYAPAVLAQLAAAVEDAIHAQGFAREARAFTPHLTLARARREARPAQLAAVAPALARQTVPPVTGVLEQLVLFESQLKRGGAVYNALARTNLRAKG